MSSSPKRILIIEDNREVRLAALFVLEAFGYRVCEVENPVQAKQWLEANQADIILLDMNFDLDSTSGEEGLGFLRWKQQQAIATPIIAMTAWSNTQLVVDAMQLGANDFIEKPWDNLRLKEVIEQQLDVHTLQANAQSKPDTPVKLQSDLIYHSEQMQKLLQQLQAVAQSDANILLLGENGTGKSQLAHWIHQQSSVAQGPFVTTNMAAIPEQLFESELFGHKKGAFTDAKTNREGRFEQAQHGTLFLDELACLPTNQQAKLLRVLESGEYEAVGAEHTQASNARIISASNGDFAELIRSGAFRQDLFFRLNTLTFTIPPLRERRTDILPQARHFIAKHCQRYNKPIANLSDCAEQKLHDYHWPGNSRELNHCLERAVLLSLGDTLKAEDIQVAELADMNNAGYGPELTLAQVEKQHIMQALAHSNQNKAQAAQLLGITKQSLYRRLEKYELV